MEGARPVYYLEEHDGAEPETRLFVFEDSVTHLIVLLIQHVGLSG